MRTSLFKPLAFTFALLTSGTAFTQSTEPGCWKTVDSLQQVISKLREDLRREKQANPQPTGDSVEIGETELERERLFHGTLLNLGLAKFFEGKMIDQSHYKITLRKAVAKAMNEGHATFKEDFDIADPTRQSRMQWNIFDYMGKEQSLPILMTNILSLAYQTANSFAPKSPAGGVTNPPTANYFTINLDGLNPEAREGFLNFRNSPMNDSFGNLLTAKRDGQNLVTFK